MRGKSVGFYSATASSTGRAHREIGRNNQDASFGAEQDGCYAITVSDGCSGTPSAEVGASLTARASVYAALRWAQEHPHEHPSRGVHAIVDEVLRSLRSVSHAIGGHSNGSVVVADMLLATMLTALVTPEGAAVFGIGDGVVGVDDDVRIEPTPARGPEYLAYALDSSGWVPNVKLHFSLEIGAFSSILLATDGAQNMFRPALSPVSLVKTEVASRPASLRWQLEAMVRDAAVQSDDDVTVALLVREP